MFSQVNVRWFRRARVGAALGLLPWLGAGAEVPDFNALDLGDLCGDGCKLFARGRFETPNLLASRLVNAKLVRVSEEVLGVQSIPNASA